MTEIAKPILPPALCLLCSEIIRPGVENMIARLTRLPTQVQALGPYHRITLVTNTPGKANAQVVTNEFFWKSVSTGAITGWHPLGIPSQFDEYGETDSRAPHLGIRQTDILPGSVFFLPPLGYARLKPQGQLIIPCLLDTQAAAVQTQLEYHYKNPVVLKRYQDSFDADTQFFEQQAGINPDIERINVPDLREIAFDLTMQTAVKRVFQDWFGRNRVCANRR
jgi:hypothetical protein